MSPFPSRDFDPLEYIDIRLLVSDAWLLNLSAQPAWLFVGVFATFFFVSAIILLNN